MIILEVTKPLKFSRNGISVVYYKPGDRIIFDENAKERFDPRKQVKGLVNSGFAKIVDSPEPEVEKTEKKEKPKAENKDASPQYQDKKGGKKKGGIFGKAK